MTDDQFQEVIARLEQLRVGTVDTLTKIEHRLDAIEQNLRNLALVLVEHLADHTRDRP